MACKYCTTNPIIKLPTNNLSLCSGCFNSYFEKKTYRTITKYSMIKKGDLIGVALSGGKDSSALIHVLNKLQKKTGIFQLSAILIDEGIRNYRSKTKSFAKKVCKKEDVPLKIVSFKDEFGSSLDSLVKKTDLNPCSVCGVLRRYVLNKYSVKLGFSKLATAHNLDDEAQSVLMNLFKNNLEVQARLGPVNGIKTHKSFIPRIKPFYFLSEKEVATYSFTHKLLYPAECPYHKTSLREDVRSLLNKFESKYPGTKHSVINSFLEILPLLKEKFSASQKINVCKRCFQPSKRKLCKTCILIENLK